MSLTFQSSWTRTMSSALSQRRRIRAANVALEWCQLIWNICTILKICEVHGTGLLCLGRLMTLVSLSSSAAADSSMFSQWVKTVRANSDTKSVSLSAFNSMRIYPSGSPETLGLLMVVSASATHLSSPLEAVASPESLKAMSGPLGFAFLGAEGLVDSLVAFSTTVARVSPFWWTLNEMLWKP